MVKDELSPGKAHFGIAKVHEYQHGSLEYQSPAKTDESCSRSDAWLPLRAISEYLSKPSPTQTRSRTRQLADSDLEHQTRGGVRVSE